MANNVKSFLAQRFLRDIENLPFLCIVQDGDETRVYTRNMNEFPKELVADLILLTERDLHGDEDQEESS